MKKVFHSFNVAFLIASLICNMLPIGKVLASTPKPTKKIQPWEQKARQRFNEANQQFNEASRLLKGNWVQDAEQRVEDIEKQIQEAEQQAKNAELALN